MIPEINKYNINRYGILNILAAPIKPIIYSICGGLDGGLMGFFYPPKEFSKFSFLKGYQYEGGSEDEDDEPGILKRTVAGILGIPLGLGSFFIFGVTEQSKVVKEYLNSFNEIENNMENEYKEKFNINKVQANLLMEELKKFVFFKDNKVVGFVKFVKDITPPVNGYYFNCEFKMKIEVNISGIILNRNKCLKTQIDLYDSDEYIAKMKNIFKTN